MSFKKAVLAVAIAACTGLVALPAFSQTTPSTTGSTTTPAAKLSSQYQTFAGSQKNSDGLITALRDGTSVTLVGPTLAGLPTTPSATFTPATGKLGYGNINIALSLAKADLAKVGITNPTPTQLAAALNGGNFATTTGPVTMTGVLAQRQSGLGWGEIAKTMDVNLGSLVSSSKTDKAQAKSGTPGKSGETHASNASSAKGNSSGHDSSAAGHANSGNAGNNGNSSGSSGGNAGGGNGGGAGGGNGGGGGGKK